MNKWSAKSECGCWLKIQQAGDTLHVFMEIPGLPALSAEAYPETLMKEPILQHFSNLRSVNPEAVVWLCGQIALDTMTQQQVHDAIGDLAGAWEGHIEQL